MRVDVGEGLAAQEHTGWRPRLATWAYDVRTLYRRHPWLLQADLPDLSIGPNRIAWIEAGLQALGETGLSASDRLEVVNFVYAYVHGTAQLSRQWGQDESQAWTATSPLMRRVHLDSRFPNFRLLLEAGDLDENWGDQTASDAVMFAFGLERALDGVAAYIAAKP